MWVSTLLDVCRLMGNYPISYMNIVSTGDREGVDDVAWWVGVLSLLVGILNA